MMSSERKGFFWIGVILSLAAVAGCSSRDTSSPANVNAEAGQSDRTLGEDHSKAKSPSASEPLKNNNRFPLDEFAAKAWIEDERDRWLFVKQIRGEAKGAWATGDFDERRNKLDIRTQDVASFAIDTAKIEIDWKRPVILGIDGLNSELKKREKSLLIFEVDSYGAWVVRE